MTVGIVGLGLIGGSMAKSIKTRTDHRVLGADIDAETMLLARLSGAVDGELNGETLGGCDLIFLALRPAAAVRWAGEHAALVPAGAVLMDLCGVKRAVVGPLGELAARHGFCYIGGHPMAGRERGGFTASSDDLFVGASMIVTPPPDTDIARLESLKNFFLDLGFARLTVSDPDEHDRIIALTSQLAHVVSGAYVRSPAAQERHGFSAGSFRDMTRVARMDEDMWTELMLDNADYLSAELSGLIGRLDEVLAALNARDAGALRALLHDGRVKKSTAGGS